MTHTAPAAWWDESTETLATVLDVLDEIRKRQEEAQRG